MKAAEVFVVNNRPAANGSRCSRGSLLASYLHFAMALLKDPVCLDTEAKSLKQEPVLNVLAVEDDPSVACVVSLCLSGPTCAVTSVESAEEALTAIVDGSLSFDVVITDNKMPIISGTQLVQRLRGYKFTGRIVVLSAYISPEDEEVYKSHKVHLILPKPFALSDLRQAIGL